MSTRRQWFDQILVDLNTQCDFLLPRGALPVANRSHILPNIRKIMNWARINRLPVISSLESHRTSESFRGFPPYCVDRTNGQRKLPFTLLPRRVLVHGDNTLDLPCEAFRRYQQVIFTKRDRDFLTNPKADRLINSIDFAHLIVFGMIAEHCVKAAVLGLLARQFRVVVVGDACGHWSPGDGELSLRQMEAKGAVMTHTDELVSGALTERLAGVEAECRAAAMAAQENSDDNGHRKDGLAAQNGNGRSRSVRIRIARRREDRDDPAKVGPSELVSSKRRPPDRKARPRRGLA